MSLVETFTFGQLRVFIETATGRIVAVKTLAGNFARGIFPDSMILNAARMARMAWESLADEGPCSA